MQIFHIWQKARDRLFSICLFRVLPCIFYSALLVCILQSVEKWYHKVSVENTENNSFNASYLLILIKIIFFKFEYLFNLSSENIIIYNTVAQSVQGFLFVLICSTILKGFVPAKKQFGTPAHSDTENRYLHAGSYISTVELTF